MLVIIFNFICITELVAEMKLFCVMLCYTDVLCMCICMYRPVEEPIK